MRLANASPGTVPVRIGLLLPFSNGSSATRVLAKAMMNAAQLAVFDAKNANILLLPADEGSTPQEAAAAARTLMSEGAEIILGPLFAPSVSAVAPVARDHAIPVIAFSTDRGVAGDGVYLLSYQPENEVTRVVSYAATHGHKIFTALLPRTPYGDRVKDALKKEAAAEHLTVKAILQFDPHATDLGEVTAAAKNTGADTFLIAQGGSQLSTIAVALHSTGTQLLGTGLWSEKASIHDPAVSGGWFAAPAPKTDARFEEHYRAAFGAAPPQLAPLAYDAVSLVAALSSDPPYHRFTDAALTDPDGFSGITGAFRFAEDGSCERELAILVVEPNGPQVLDAAPSTFGVPAS